jgi:hypothetical protein
MRRRLETFPHRRSAVRRWGTLKESALTAAVVADAASLIVQIQIEHGRIGRHPTVLDEIVRRSPIEIGSRRPPYAIRNRCSHPGRTRGAPVFNTAVAHCAPGIGQIRAGFDCVPLDGLTQRQTSLGRC